MSLIFVCTNLPLMFLYTITVDIKLTQSNTLYFPSKIFQGYLLVHWSKFNLSINVINCNANINNKHSAYLH